MTIQIDTIEFYLIIFFIFVSCAISVLLLYKYFNYGYAIKEEINKIVNYSSALIKKESENNIDKQMKLFKMYMNNTEELVKKLEDAQFKSYNDFQIQIESIKQDLLDIHRKIKKENELQKEIREKDGIIARKNKEISKLKARIKNVNN